MCRAADARPAVEAWEVRRVPVRGPCWWTDSGVAGWGWRRGDPLDLRADVGTPEARGEPVEAVVMETKEGD